jgi:hypothetical protein
MEERRTAVLLNTWGRYTGWTYNSKKGRDNTMNYWRE